MKSEQSIQEIRSKKDRLREDIYLSINRFIQDTGVYPIVSGKAKAHPDGDGGFIDLIDVTVDVVL